MHKNHWIDQLKREFLAQLLHESHIALWKLKCREENAIADNNWAAASVAAMQIDAEKELYRKLKDRLTCHRAFEVKG